MPKRKDSPKATLKSSDMKINSPAFRSILERVHIQGLIDECLLQVSESNGYVSAVDMTNSVLLAASQAGLGLNDDKYGISKLGTLVKFLGTCQDEDLAYSIDKDEKWLTIRRKGHGKIKVLLLEPEMVGTKLEEDPDVDGLIEGYEFQVTLSTSFLTDALFYINLIGSQAVQFTVRGKRAFFTSVGNEVQQFEVPIGTVEKGDGDTATQVYSDQVKSVLNTITIEENSSLYIKGDHPIIFMQDMENFWALTPILPMRV